MTIELSIVLLFILGVNAGGFKGPSTCSSSVPHAVLDVPFTFALNGFNQTVNGDYIVCADVGSATSGLAIYFQSVANVNSAPVVNATQISAPFSPFLLALPLNETRARGHFFTDLRAGHTEFISVGCHLTLPQWWMFGLFDLKAELAESFYNNGGQLYNFPPFNVSVTFVLKKLPALFC
jgi:hypothetical protein